MPCLFKKKKKKNIGRTLFDRSHNIHGILIFIYLQDQSCRKLRGHLSLVPLLTDEGNRNPEGDLPKVTPASNWWNLEWSTSWASTTTPALPHHFTPPHMVLLQRLRSSWSKTSLSLLRCN